MEEAVVLYPSPHGWARIGFFFFFDNFYINLLIIIICFICIIKIILTY
jgi:hypothetical protein